MRAPITSIKDWISTAVSYAIAFVPYPRVQTRFIILSAGRTGSHMKLAPSDLSAQITNDTEVCRALAKAGYTDQFFERTFQTSSQEWGG